MQALLCQHTGMPWRETPMEPLLTSGQYPPCFYQMISDKYRHKKHSPSSGQTFHCLIIAGTSIIHNTVCLKEQILVHLHSTDWQRSRFRTASGTHINLWTDMYREQIYPVVPFSFAKKSVHSKHRCVSESTPTTDEKTTCLWHTHCSFQKLNWSLVWIHRTWTVGTFL